MKSLLKISLWIALSAIILSACSKDADILLDSANKTSRRTNAITTESKEWFIDLEEALSLSNQFMDWEYGNELRSSEKDKTLKKASVIKSKKKKNKNGRMESDTLMYVFNYTDGFTIVSATKEVNPILAYSDESFFDENDSTNLGTLIWLDYMKKNIEDAIENEDSTINMNYLDTYNSIKASFSQRKNTDVTLRAAQYYNEIRNYKKVGPLLTTKWDQNYPYNSRYPTFPLSEARPPAGCVPIAIAQVVNYYKILNGANINWTAINNGNTDAIAELIFTIGDGIGMTCTPDYSYPNLCFPDIFCYRGRIQNYLNGKGYNTNFVNLGSQTPVTCPAIYEGFTENFIGWPNWFGGHWWVMDGYESYELWQGWAETANLYEPSPPAPGVFKSAPQTLTDPSNDPLMVWGYLFLHFNWGQPKGQSNAWYGVSNSYTYTNTNGSATVYKESFKRLDISKK